MITRQRSHLCGLALPWSTFLQVGKQVPRGNTAIFLDCSRVSLSLHQSPPFTCSFLHTPFLTRRSSANHRLGPSHLLPERTVLSLNSSCLYPDWSHVGLQRWMEEVRRHSQSRVKTQQAIFIGSASSVPLGSPLG